MASKKKPRNTKWTPTTWERTYRSDPIWVEKMFIDDPKWSWTTFQGTEGRAKTKLAAMRAAEKSIDASQMKAEDR